MFALCELEILTGILGGGDPHPTLSPVSLGHSSSSKLGRCPETVLTEPRAAMSHHKRPKSPKSCWGAAGLPGLPAPCTSGPHLGDGEARLDADMADGDFGSQPSSPHHTPQYGGAECQGLGELRTQAGPCLWALGWEGQS